ncbi:MAG: hypothetical protein PSX36_06515 [bacterium]|nr:hypothetical protein [bacterium]
MKYFFSCVFLAYSALAAAQAPKPSAYEYRWALLHPFAALVVNKITKACDQDALPKWIQLELDSFSNGGAADAFRHVFYMAAYRQKIGERKLRKLGQAHEKHNYHQFLKDADEYGERPDSIGSVMDLQNNEVGFEIGRLYKNLSLLELRRAVIEQIKAGNAFILKRNRNGKYLSCEGEVIDLTKYNKTWNIPKCLVYSNYKAEF